MTKAELTNEVTSLILNAVQLRHVDPKTLSDSTSLRDGGLELDSVDILEVVVTIEHHYGIQIDDPEKGKVYFRSIGSVVDFVESQRAK